eukprot:jgi/Psemu1/6637/gm1.6637_g
MGACFSQGHERLNEYDDYYFMKVENRNSFDENKTRWWRQRISSVGSKSTDQLTSDGFDRSPVKSPVDHWTIQTSECEPSPMTNDVFEDISFSFSSPLSLNSISLSSFSHRSLSSEKSDSLRNHKILGGERRNQKGSALQHRLANHRHLQLAVTNKCDAYESPVTPVALDSKLFTQDYDPYETDESAQDRSVSSRTIPDASVSEEPTSKDENMSSNSSRAFIWKEIRNESNITALAMNHVTFDSSFKQSGPLMLAMGDERGSIVVTQIMDEGVQKIADNDSDDSSEDSNMDLGTNTLEFSIKGRVRSLDFGGSKYLVVGGDDCYAWVLQLVVHESSKTLQEIKVVHQLERIDRIYAVRFSPNLDFIAVGGFDGKVALIPTTLVRTQDEPKSTDDSNNDSLPLQLNNDSVIELDRPGLVYCLDWSPAGDYLTIAGSDKVCSVYSASTLGLIHETTNRSSTIHALRWSHDGNYFAIGDREVVVLDGNAPFEIQYEVSHTPKSSAMEQFRYRVTSICWSPSDSFLAIGGSDGRCLVVETNTWALVYEHLGTERINALAWGQQINALNGDIRRYLVLSDNDCTVALIKAGTEPQSYESADDYSSVASSSYYSQSTVASDWVLREDEFRDLDDVPREMPRGLKSQATITAVAFSKVGKAGKPSPYLAYAADDFEFAKPIRSLVFSNSNNYLALGGDEGVLNVLSVRSRTLILNSILSSPITSLAFSRHDERLGVGLEDGILALLCPDSDWESVGEIDQNESSVTCQDWTSNMLACGRVDGSVTLFETEKAFDNFFVPVAEFTGNLPVRSIAFGTNGRFLSIGGDNGVVSILSAKSGWVLCNHLDLGCGILSTKWSPAGQYVAFAGSGETFRVCDSITWKTVGESRWYVDGNRWVGIGHAFAEHLGLDAHGAIGGWACNDRIGGQSVIDR